MKDSGFIFFNSYYMNKRKIGLYAESLVKDFYLWQWYKLVCQNYTIRWGEIDLIVSLPSLLVFVEVKSVFSIDDMIDYVTRKKMEVLLKTVDAYLWKHPTSKEYRFDIVFVKDNKILEVYYDLDL